MTDGQSSPVTEQVLLRLILVRGLISMPAILAGIGFLAIGGWLVEVEQVRQVVVMVGDPVGQQR